MTKGDFYQDDIARKKRSGSEGRRSEGRRRGRLRRKSTFGLIILGFVVLVVVAAPSLFCHSPIARSLARSTFAGYGFEGGVQSIRMGWVTPLRVDGLDLIGMKAGSHLQINRIETDITLLRCLQGLSDLGEVTIRGVVAEVSVSEGTSSLEQDLADFLASEPGELTSEKNESESAPLTGKISAHEIAIRITDTVTDSSWIAGQAKADVELGADKVDLTFSTVLTDPLGGSGELEGRVQYPMLLDQAYQISLLTQRVPLSFALLAKRRLGETGAAIPSQISGDSSGSLTVAGGVGDAISVAASPIEFRNFVASDVSLGERVWRNGLTVISGSATVDGDRIIGRNLQLTTDFGSAKLDGAFNTSISLAGDSNPAVWLDALDGSAGATIDLVAFEKALPGFIPLREQTEITAGAVTAEITSTLEAGSVRRSHWNLQSQPIRATAAGRPVTIEPATLTASIRVTGRSLAADTIRLQSTFANATVDGDLSQGRINGEIQFSRLAAMIQPLLDMPDLSLAGTATCEVNWAAEAGQLWRLDGKSNATDLVIALPAGIQIQQSSVTSEVNATGRWANGTLRDLSALAIFAATPGVELQAKLTAPVSDPMSMPLPLRIDSRGRLESLASLAGPWMPSSINTLQGSYTAEAIVSVGTAGGEVINAKFKIDEPRVGYEQQMFLQSQLAFDFDGKYAWPEGILDARKITVVGDAFSAAVQGSMTSQEMKFDVAWRAKMDRLQDALRPNVASLSSVDTRPVAFRNEPVAAPSAYQYLGDFEGRLTASQEKDSKILLVNSQTTGNNFQVVSLSPIIATNASASPTKPLWAERVVNLDTVLRYNLTDGKVDAEKLQLITDWIATSLTGKAIWNEAIGDVAMRGTARVKMPEVAKQLTTMLGTPVELIGTHETPVEIIAARNGAGPMALAINANVGWESGKVAGITFGPTSIPVTMNETTVSVKPASIPVEQGRLQLAGDLHYSPGPMWMAIRPGVVAEDLRLTPELTNAWLQYLAPMVANATRVEGTFGVELAEAIVNLEDPMASKVRGSLRVTGVNLDSGPVANQIISSIKQIQQLVKGLNTEPVQAKEKRLVTFPTQSVDFQFVDGVASHQRMFMEIDRARIITSGQVHADGRLAMVAQLPLDPSWLGSDLKGLAGQSVTLPINGTLSRPSLDAAGIRQLVTDLGTKALQSTAESYLEKQLGRGLEKLWGR